MLQSLFAEQLHQFMQDYSDNVRVLLGFFGGVNLSAKMTFSFSVHLFLSLCS